jgi:hypothetical protein
MELDKRESSVLSAMHLLLFASRHPWYQRKSKIVPFLIGEQLFLLLAFDLNPWYFEFPCWTDENTGIYR